MNKIDLRTCKKGDILISSQGAILEYVSPTPHGNHTYLDHVVKYIEVDGVKVGGSYGSRTHDGFVFKFHRQSTDHDIIRIIPKGDMVITCKPLKYEFI